jgi:molybdenum cofactor biosynthesis enzyme MoaA
VKRKTETRIIDKIRLDGDISHTEFINRLTEMINQAETYGYSDLRFDCVVMRGKGYYDYESMGSYRKVLFFRKIPYIRLLGYKLEPVEKFNERVKLADKEQKIKELEAKIDRIKRQ